jgi:isocitrate/isopropylmalate dehydrogenase
MTKKFDIVVFPGDFGGPEVMAEGIKVLNALSISDTKILLIQAFSLIFARY